MITYYKKMEVMNVIELTEAIEYTLSHDLLNVNKLNVRYDACSLQLRICIIYKNGKRIFIAIEPEGYSYLLDTNASQWDYDYFITHLKYDIKSRLLEDYIK